MSIWQTKHWQEMLQKSLQTETFFEIDGVFIEKRKVSLGEYWLFVIWLNKELTEKQIQLFQQLCKKEKCLFIQIESIQYTEVSFFQNVLPFKEWYYKKFIPPYTAVIDLTKNEEEILNHMKPKGRYNINLAGKKWVTVWKVEKIKENIEVYHSLMQETTSRDNFSGNTYWYYETFLTTLENSELFIAYFEWKAIAGWIFVFKWDTSYYYYGASSNEHRNLMAPYLLQWSAILEAKKRACKIYDFLWIATPWEENSSLAGVTDFKLKLSQDSRKVSESIIWIHKKWKYRLIQIARKLKK